MRRKDDDVLTLLTQMPWWVSVCVAAVVYVALSAVIPSILFANPLLKGMAPLPAQFAWISIIFLVPAAISALESLRKRTLLEQQTGIESIRTLSWKQFEELLAEAYRRQGYAVKENAFAGPDGGIDLVIERNRNVYLVQCKQWRASRVGVNVVREMFGLITAHKARGGIIVTSGSFTQDAHNFALGKPIGMVEGSASLNLVRDGQTRSPMPPPPVPQRLTGVVKRENSNTQKVCPRCGMHLSLRTAKRGKHAGSKFLGCTAFPKCRYIEDYKG